MTTTTLSDKKFVRMFRALNIPPVYYFLIVIFLASGIIDQVFSDGQILGNPAITMNILVRSVALGIVAVGQTLVIIGGSIDLSVAYLISITSVMSSYIMQGKTENVFLAIVVVFAIGITVGLVNGLIVTKLHVNPFIATLGMALILKGIINGTFSNYTGSVPRSFEFFGYERFGPIPVSVIILFLVVIGGWFLLTRTKFGAHLYGVGGNVEVARLSGLRTDRVIIGAHILCSMTAVLTGLFIVSRLRAGAPWVGPDGVYDLESIATVVIGGTLLSGGKGGVWGTLAGVIIFGILETAFNQLGVNPYLTQVLRGAIVILAVASYTYRSKAMVA